MVERYCRHTKAVFKVSYSALFIATTHDQDMSIVSSAGGIEGFHRLPRQQTLCSHAMLLKDDVFVVQDARKDWRFKGLASELGVGYGCVKSSDPLYFYASAPLKLSTPSLDPRLPEEMVQVGRLAIMSNEFRDFTQEDSELLNNIASMLSEAIENEFRGLLAAKSKRIQQTLGQMARLVEDPEALSFCAVNRRKLGKAVADPKELDARNRGFLCPLRTEIICEKLRETLGAATAYAIDVTGLKPHESHRYHGRSLTRKASAYPEMPWLADGSPNASRAGTPPLTSTSSRSSVSSDRNLVASPDGSSSFSHSSSDGLHMRSASSGTWAVHVSESDLYDTPVQASDLPQLVAWDGPLEHRPNVSTQAAARELRDFLAAVQGERRNARFYTARSDDSIAEHDEHSDLNESETSSNSTDSNPLAAVLPPDSAMYATVPIFTVQKTQPVLLLILTFSELTALDDTDLLFLNASASILDASIARVQAASTDKAQLHFIQTVQHELRTPLHGILGISEFLRHAVSNRALPAEAAKAGLSEDAFLSKCLDMIKLAGGSLVSLVDDVLDFGDISGVRSHTAVEPAQEVDICSLMEGVAAVEFESAQLIRRQQQDAWMESHMPTVVLGIQDEVRLWGWKLQPTYLRKSLHKLVSNAFKFTGKGSVEIFVGITNQVDLNGKRTGEETLGFIITDTGLGMPKDFVKDGLTKPFVKYDSFTPGAGLGMTLAVSLVTKMRGQLHISSTFQEGTRVSLSIPALRGSRNAAEPICFRRQPGAALPTQTVFFQGLLANNPACKMLQKFLLGRDIVETAQSSEADYIVIDALNTAPFAFSPQARIVLVCHTLTSMDWHISRFNGHALHSFKAPFGPRELLKLHSFIKDPAPFILQTPAPKHTSDSVPTLASLSLREEQEQQKRTATPAPESLEVTEVVQDANVVGSDKEFRVLVVEVRTNDLWCCRIPPTSDAFLLLTTRTTRSTCAC